MTNTYSAEYGRTSGGFVMFQVKSRAQHYHGSLYEFHRNSALDAKHSNPAGKQKLFLPFLLIHDGPRVLDRDFDHVHHLLSRRLGLAYAMTHL